MIYSERAIFQCAYCGERASRKGRFLEHHHYCSWACELKETWLNTTVIGTFFVIGAITTHLLSQVFESSLYTLSSVVFFIVGIVLMSMGSIGHRMVQNEPKNRFN